MHILNIWYLSACSLLKYKCPTFSADGDPTSFMAPEHWLLIFSYLLPDEICQSAMRLNKNMAGLAQSDYLVRHALSTSICPSLMIDYSGDPWHIEYIKTGAPTDEGNYCDRGCVPRGNKSTATLPRWRPHLETWRVITALHLKIILIDVVSTLSFLWRYTAQVRCWQVWIRCWAPE